MFKDMTDRIAHDYHLFKQDHLKLWVNVSTFFTHPSIKGKTSELNEVLVEEYNKTLEEYKEISGNELEQKTLKPSSE